MKIYTKTGDDGSTGLYGPGRVPKHSLRIEAIGEIDELNATLGQAIGYIATPDLRSELNEIQCRLFDLGAELAARRRLDGSGITMEDIAELEVSIDTYTAELPPLRAFILPGGSISASAFHLSRTVCRRAERRLFALDAEESVSTEIKQYLNRLSDWLFTVARLCNKMEAVPETEWHRKEIARN